jgi:hypothetical protein
MVVGSLRGRQALDAIVYAVVVTAIVGIGSTAISFVLGWGLVGVKFILFVIGFVLFGAATFKLRPTAPWREENGSESSGVSYAGSDNDSPLQRAIYRVLPLDQYELHPKDRLSDGAKLFLASVLMLVISFLMESVFDVAR